VQLEQSLIEAVRTLAPDNQKAVLEFAKFLESRQDAKTKSVDGTVSLAEVGISVDQAADLQSRLQTFSEDWNRPEMDAYDEL